jgi:hypothetical protein
MYIANGQTIKPWLCHPGATRAGALPVPSKPRIAINAEGHHRHIALIPST